MWLQNLSRGNWSFDSAEVKNNENKPCKKGIGAGFQ
jgi:hypothetical protein